MKYLVLSEKICIGFDAEIDKMIMKEIKESSYQRDVLCKIHKAKQCKSPTLLEN